MATTTRLQSDDKWIAVCQLRHIFKIHPVPAGNQSQWKKIVGNNRQKLHVGILMLCHFSDKYPAPAQYNPVRITWVRPLSQSARSEIKNKQILAGKKLFSFSSSCLPKVMQLVVILS